MSGRTLILCDGVRDVYFLGGALKARFGWTADLNAGKKRVFAKRTTHFYRPEVADKAASLEVVELGSHENVLSSLSDRIAIAGTESAEERLCVVLDADSGTAADRAKAVDNRIGTLGRDRSKPWPCWHVQGLEHTVQIDLIVWEPAHMPSYPPGATKTLETLIMSAVEAATTEAGEATSAAVWLTNRPARPASHEHKAYLGAYAAGWFPDQWGNPFYRQIWENPLLRPYLETVLKGCGAYDVLASL